MKDRQSRYPGRVILTPVQGQANTYDITMADEPTEQGTPPTTANLLSIETARDCGFSDSHNTTVNEAIDKVACGTFRKKQRITTSITSGTFAQVPYTKVNPYGIVHCEVISYTDSNSVGLLAGYANGKIWMLPIGQASSGTQYTAVVDVYETVVQP